MELSHGRDAELEVEGLGGELMPFQRAGVAYALERRRVFIADEQGLGKTIQALATLQAALPEEPREAGVMVNVNELLRQVLELETDRLLAAGIMVDWHPAPQLPELPGHKNSLRSLFKHLIDNSIHALSESRRSHREINLATRSLDGAVEVEIQDNGPGIPVEERYRVFEPFFIGWRNRRGKAGMGLALAQEIVNAHGGGIEVDPDFKGGCRILLTLSAALADQ
jgi:nitrogen fixation negative regulator NifL